MAEILIFSGTTEGRELAEALCAVDRLTVWRVWRPSTAGSDASAGASCDPGRADGRTGDGRTSCEPVHFLQWWTPRIPTRWR